MKSSFINQVVVATVLIATLCWMVLGEKGMPLFFGAAWGSANLWLLKQLAIQVFLKQRKNYLKIGALLALKCPLFYVLGYLLLKTHLLSITYLIIGFSLLFAAMLLIALKELFTKKTTV